MSEQKDTIFTPFNIVSAIILAIGVPMMVSRFLYGLGSVTNLSNDYPFGLWIAFDVLTGVALAAGYSYLERQAAEALPFLPLVFTPGLLATLITGLAAGGVVFGIAGSLIATREYLRET